MIRPNLNRNYNCQKNEYYINYLQNQPMAGGAQTRAKKLLAIEKLYELFGTHKQIILANFTNVGSSQIQQIRKTLRQFNGTLVISKNTLLKKILNLRINGIEDAGFNHLKQYGGKIPQLKALLPVLKDKVALIFCDAPVFLLKQKIEANKVPTEARVGAISPMDYAVAAGPTGLDPSQINFFHALNISTKIVKGQIQITKDFKVCTTGKKVKASEAALLKKLNLKPFEYGMRTIGCYDNGTILSQEIINIDPASLLVKLQAGIKNLAGLSLETGYAIEATVPLIIANSFKNIAALSIESGYKIKELQMLATSGPAVVAEKAAEKPAAKQTKAKQPVPEPPKEQEEDGGMGGLFD